MLLAVVLIIGFFLFYSGFFRPSDTKSVDVSTILKDIKTDIISNQLDTLEVGSTTITLTRRQDGSKEKANINDTFDIKSVLKDNGIDYTHGLVLKYDAPSVLGVWPDILAGLIPSILIGGLLIFMMGRAKGNNNQAISFASGWENREVQNKPRVAPLSSDLLHKDLHCSRCHAAYQEGDAFCPQCGSTLSLEGKGEPTVLVDTLIPPTLLKNAAVINTQAVTGAATSTTRTCPSCHTTVQLGSEDRFCGNCGHPWV
jgi:RNA polymerase subunit RPABC4/transcription elongation factor Spt4